MLNLCAIQMQFLNAWSKIKFITSKRLEMGYRKHVSSNLILFNKN